MQFGKNFIFTMTRFPHYKPSNLSCVLTEAFQQNWTGKSDLATNNSGSELDPDLPRNLLRSKPEEYNQEPSLFLRFVNI